MRKLTAPLLFLTVLAVSCLSVPATKAADLEISYDYPAESLSDVAEFRAYELAPGTGAATLVGKTVGTPAALKIEVKNVNPGVHTYFVTAFSTFWKMESARSNNASTPPGGLAPGNIKVKVTTTTIGRANIKQTMIEFLAAADDTPKKKK